ncbi:Trk family potassium uptake protein [bacterium]|nr:Trk family potassium uptake protein [bacterium]
MQLGRLHQSITKFPLPPSLLLVGSFVAIIIAGTLLLLLPRATVSGKISFVDALFTATSATCVTGLIVVDTGTYFAKFGQTVILLLIQLGGLGLMTFATFFALIIRGELGLRERMLLGDILNIRAFSKIKSLIKSIIVATVLIEMTGAILIYLVFKGTPPAGEGGLYSSIFHSVSAFCNAGFSLFSTSFIEYQSHLGMNLIITGLIILGGFGFVVIADIWRYITSPFKDKFRRLPHFSLQTRVVFSTSLILIALGTVIIFTIDYNHHLANLPLGTKLLASYFQSVTSRTAGFNTLDIARVHIGTLWILVILMFIGASPGSTGGGIKTTSFATLFALIKSKIKGIGEVNLFNRRIPLDVIHGAIMVTVLGFSVFFTGALILSITESAAFEHILFEVMSAFGTVGLSCGITSSLSTIGKLVITVIMLVGRIGPLTLIFAIPSKRSEGKFRYTEERVMIG